MKAEVSDAIGHAHAPIFGLKEVFVFWHLEVATGDWPI
jgi:hypothetical protein